MFAYRISDLNGKDHCDFTQKPPNKFCNHYHIQIDLHKDSVFHVSHRVWHNRNTVEKACEQLANFLKQIASGGQSKVETFNGGGLPFCIEVEPGAHGDIFELSVSEQLDDPSWTLQLFLTVERVREGEI